MENSTYQVLLYYKYTSLTNPEKVVHEQRNLCESLNLKGRIIIAKEGINGTVEGLTHDTEKYIKEMQKNKYFNDIHFKKSPGNGKAFKKLQVRVRPEVVTGGLPELNPNKTTGNYISAEQLHQWIIEKKEFYIVDMRNDYEYASGFFEGSILSGFSHYRDLPKVLSKLHHLKNKTIVTVCTGGIRCEKASGFLVVNGFADVYQLQDGIHNYMEKYPNEHFKGKLYVFDSRLIMGFNTTDSKHEIVGKCMHCQSQSENYVNCMYDECHYHYISCLTCIDKETNLAFCKKICKDMYLKNLSNKTISR